MKLNLITGLITLLLMGVVSPLQAEDDDAVNVDVSEPSQNIEEKTQPLAESPLHFGLDLAAVYRQYKSYVFSPSGITSDQGGWGFQGNFEWMPITQYGKLGVGVGVGIFRLGNVEQGDGAAATLLVFPLEAHLSYRLDFLQDQILVPFAKVGPSLSVTNQRSNFETYNQNDYKTYKGLELSFGGELLLDIFEKRSARKLDARAGINSSYLVFAYVISKPLGTSGVQPDLSRTGELRVGLRLEI